MPFVMGVAWEAEHFLEVKVMPVVSVDSWLVVLAFEVERSCTLLCSFRPVSIDVLICSMVLIFQRESHGGQ